MPLLLPKTHTTPDSRKPHLNSNNAATILLKCSNIQPTSSFISTHSPHWNPFYPRQPPLLHSFSFPAKTILLFNPTGSERERKTEEGVGGERTVANSLFCLFSPSTNPQWAMPGRVKEERQRERKKNNNRKQRNPHISRIIPSRRKQLWFGNPLLV